MHLDYSHLFEQYKDLVSEADRAFEQVREMHPGCVRCTIECCDCCYAFFELFLIEAVHLSYQFNRLLARKERRDVIKRAAKSESQIIAIRQKLGLVHPTTPEHTEEDVLQRLGAERVRCPLLNDTRRCALYEYRPITCRLYGIPTRIDGAGHTCGKSGFAKGLVYPAVNLDIIYDKLRLLSQALIEDMESHREYLADP